MEQNKTLTNTCNVMGIKPAMAELSYPNIQVEQKNLNYANILKVDYCGAVSELSAITQYINNETYLSNYDCSVARTVIGIAMAEMMHLEKLGLLITLLGGDLDYHTFQNGLDTEWTPKFLTLSKNPSEMIRLDIQAEKEAIEQYRKHIQMINDKYVKNILQRIIKNEEYHIFLFQSLLEKL